MIDPRRDAPIENAVVVIRDDRIESAGAASSVTVPAGARVLDLSGYTILPGLMDCHVHITGTPGDGGDTQKLKETAAHDAIHGVAHAKITLEAGFTTIRNVGSGNYADAALRDLIERGVVPGPRMWVATRGLGATGGHADINGWSSDLKLPGTAEIADGVDELRKAVRTQIKNGADLIKVTATGGILSVGDAVTHQQYSLEELEAIVETASMLGVKVAAHAHSPGGMNAAVRAGVASIEHGSLIDDEGICLMKERGTFLVPTLYTLDFIIQEGAASGVPQYSIDKAKSIARQQRERLSAAFHAGVKFAYGTAAELIGIEDRAGTLEPGKWADIVAVAGNPLEDITLLENVRFVMKGGVVYKSP
jgi:imidazolonepropionase-like amidohydrolase